MGEAHDHHQAAVSVAVAAPSRLGVRSRGGGGEIVEVQGGHIVRSTGRKDRHSKVCTAKGLRDRRVRLSAHTAIQFYDVQDRLGYDRPSKAVDWLIKKAKSAIDELAELPAWKPTAMTPSAAAGSSRVQETAQHNEQPESQSMNRRQDQDQMDLHHGKVVSSKMLSGASGAIASSSVQNYQQIDENRGFLPSSLDTDSIADTVKSFFPMGADSETQHQQQQSAPALQSIQFHRYSHLSELLSRTSSHQNQDLRLSLHSFQDPLSLHHHHQQTQHHEPPPSVAAVAFSGTSHVGFNTSSTSSIWSDVARFQRMPVWNTATTADTGSGSSGGAFAFGSQPMPQPLLGQSQYFSQRGPLQSSYMPSLRAWINPTITPEHHIPHQLIDNSPSVPSLEIGTSGFFGYHIPARIQGQEEDHDDGAILNKPSSASSNSRH